MPLFKPVEALAAYNLETGCVAASAGRRRLAQTTKTLNLDALRVQAGPAPAGADAPVPSPELNGVPLAGTLSAAQLAAVAVANGDAAPSPPPPPPPTAITISTYPYFNGYSGDFGYTPPPYVAPSFGQTLVAPANSVSLTSFKFLVNLPTTVTFVGLVYAWDTANNRATGSALYQSATVTTTAYADETVTFNTNNIAVTAGQVRKGHHAETDPEARRTFFFCAVRRRSTPRLFQPLARRARPPLSTCPDLSHCYPISPTSYFFQLYQPRRQVAAAGLLAL